MPPVYTQIGYKSAVSVAFSHTWLSISSFTTTINAQSICRANATQLRPARRFRVCVRMVHVEGGGGPGERERESARDQPGCRQGDCSLSELRECSHQWDLIQCSKMSTHDRSGKSPEAHALSWTHLYDILKKVIF